MGEVTRSLVDPPRGVREFAATLPRRFAMLTSLKLVVAAAAFSCLGGAAFADTRTITVAGGCFWCVEADFETVRGVKGAVWSEDRDADFTGRAVLRGRRLSSGLRQAVRADLDPLWVAHKGQGLQTLPRCVRARPARAPALGQRRAVCQSAASGSGKGMSWALRFFWGERQVVRAAGRCKGRLVRR